MSKKHTVYVFTDDDTQTTEQVCEDLKRIVGLGGEYGETPNEPYTEIRPPRGNSYVLLITIPDEVDCEFGGIDDVAHYINRLTGLDQTGVHARPLSEVVST